MSTAAVIHRVPAPALFVVAGVCQYVGAALAVGLFPLMPPHTVAWLRALVCAVVLLALVRPWRQRWTRPMLRETALFGVVLVAMNMLFYVAIDYLPLGAAVAVEFAGPVAVAAWGSRSVRARLSIGLAAFGVLAISLVGLRWDAAGPTTGLLLGLGCALAAGAAWGLYMVLGGRIVAQRDGLASLAVGTAIASLAFAPIGAPWAGAVLSLPVLGVAVAVGVLSSVIPYVLDQVTLKRLGTSTFALLNALLPASATVIGLIALAQRPSAGELLGLVAISAAVALSSSRRTTPLAPDAV